MSLTEHDVGSVQEQTVACKCLDYTYDCCTNRVYDEIIECKSYVRINSRPSPFVQRKKDKYNTVRPEFFYYLIYGIFFSDLGSGNEKKINKKALKMTSYKKSFFKKISPDSVKLVMSVSNL